MQCVFANTTGLTEFVVVDFFFARSDFGRGTYIGITHHAPHHHIVTCIVLVLIRSDRVCVCVCVC